MAEQNEVGDRLRALRERKGFSQKALAGLAEVSENLIKSIEIGRRPLTLDKARRLAPILGVQNLSDFYGETADLPLDGKPTHPDLPAVRRALTAWRPTMDGHAESPAYLRELVDAAWKAWHTSPTMRSDAGRMLPGLIRTAEVSARGEQRRAVLPLLAQVYHFAQAYLAWHGEREIVYLSVDRGMQAALDSDDPVAIGGSVFYAAHVLRQIGRHEEAIANLADARGLIERHLPQEGDNVEWWAMLADLWRCSGITKARSGDQSAFADMRQAEDIVTRRLPEGYAHPWTKVGRSIVDIEHVMVAVDLGQADEARRRAQHINPATIPSTERRARHYVDLAKALALEGSPEATLSLLTRAVGESAESVIYTPGMRELSEKLLRTLGATYRAEAEALARKLGVDL